MTDYPKEDLPYILLDNIKRDFEELVGLIWEKHENDSDVCVNLTSEISRISTAINNLYSRYGDQRNEPTRD